MERAKICKDDLAFLNIVKRAQAMTTLDISNYSVKYNLLNTACVREHHDPSAVING